jgi:hypothetical protein
MWVIAGGIGEETTHRRDCDGSSWDGDGGTADPFSVKASIDGVVVNSKRCLGGSITMHDGEKTVRVPLPGRLNSIHGSRL